jgi:hypothetical protein
MKHETETVNGTEYPAPGDWSVNWVEGDVLSYRHGADDGDDDRIHDGSTAHVFVQPDGFGVPDYRIDIDNERVATVDGDDVDDRDALFDRIGDILTEHGPKQ